MKKILISILMMLPIALFAQISNDDVHKYGHKGNSHVRNEISVPGFDGYQTLKCDFHIHTVFSDGEVWPNVRVREAWQEGLDAIAMTDHIEYRPHRDVMNADHNKSYEIAAAEAKRLGFILIKGSEITRSKPLGHLNAIFITDANALDVEDPLQAIDIARGQGGYIIWNHPGWPDDKSTFYPIHGELIKAGKIDAYEVYNHMESYPLTFDWYAEYDIAPMANTDIHGTVSGDFASEDGWLRPMTLVFAKERSQEGIREALDAKRTLAFFQGVLVGSEEYLTKLVQASLKVRKLESGSMQVTNISDIAFEMVHDGKLYVFPAEKTVLMPDFSGELVVRNCFCGHNRHLHFTFAK